MELTCLTRDARPSVSTSELVDGTQTGIAHAHLGAVLASELSRFDDRTPVCILDAGCGDGGLLVHLHRALGNSWPQRKIQLCGFDVVDHGVQRKGFLAHTMARLSAAAPSVDWQRDLKLISTRDNWPFADASVDIVVSNQVCEHVNDLSHFFRQTQRVLKPGGIAVNLFPLVHYINEGHLLVPFIHRCHSYDLLKIMIKMASYAHIGKFHTHRRLYGVDLETFAMEHADYMTLYTNYVSTRRLACIMKQVGLRYSFRYTPNLYWTKLRSLLRLSPRVQYRKRSSGISDWLLTWLLRYVSCVTLFLEKGDCYTQSQPTRSVMSPPSHGTQPRHL